MGLQEGREGLSRQKQFEMERGRDYSGNTRQQQTDLQGWAKDWAPGLVSFVPTVAYRFSLSLPEKFLQPLGTNF